MIAINRKKIPKYSLLSIALHCPGGRRRRLDCVGVNRSAKCKNSCTSNSRDIIFFPGSLYLVTRSITKGKLPVAYSCETQENILITVSKLPKMFRRERENYYVTNSFIFVIKLQALGGKNIIV